MPRHAEGIGFPDASGSSGRHEGGKNRGAAGIQNPAAPMLNLKQRWTDSK